MARTHENHRVQLMAPHRTTLKNNLYVWESCLNNHRIQMLLSNIVQSLTLFRSFISVFKVDHKAVILLLVCLDLSDITSIKQLLFCPV